MFRRAATFATIAAFTASTVTSSALACTGISLKASDGTVIRGRTLEFGVSLQSNVIVIPAGKELSGTLPDGGKGLTYTTKYAIVGANAFGQPAVADAVNDQGLSVGLFYFPGSASYTDATADNASHALAPYELGTWILANFATVDEVKRGVQNVVLVPTKLPGLGSPTGAVPPVHFFVKDRSGKSIAVEPVEGKARVFDAPLGVMTNAPSYDWHMTNLRNYINLSVQDVDQAKLGDVTLPAFGSGAGLVGLPGDFSPPSRFVRAAVYSANAAPVETAEEAVSAAFHILNQFDIPKGSVQNSATGKPMDEITEWTSVADLTNLRWYFRTYEDQTIRMVDLKEAVAAAKGEVRQISMESKQPVVNASTDFIDAKDSRLAAD